jgi:hypothetical protein
MLNADYTTRLASIPYPHFCLDMIGEGWARARSMLSSV